MVMCGPWLGLAAINLENVFFQADDGIRDLTVTGVQTCALPIYVPNSIWDIPNWIWNIIIFRTWISQIEKFNLGSLRSEERRVGKECRSRQTQLKLKQDNINVAHDSIYEYIYT